MLRRREKRLRSSTRKKKKKPDCPFKAFVRRRSPAFNGRVEGGVTAGTHTQSAKYSSNQRSRMESEDILSPRGSILLGSDKTSGGEWGRDKGNLPGFKKGSLGRDEGGTTKEEKQGKIL